MNAYEKIRAALNQADALIPDFSYLKTRNDEALSALAELARAAADPVAWMWNDMLGISHTYVSPKRPTWPDAGASPEMAVAINVRPLYAAPPAPVAEIRKVVVTDEMALRISEKYHGIQFESDFSVRLGRDMISAVRAELGPALGLVEIREPTPEECADMAEWFKSECAARCINPQESADYGRAIFDAVKIVLWPKEGL